MFSFELSQSSKDLIYTVGSFFGVFGFIHTLKKRERCEFTYRTELGDEVRPFIVCIKADIVNLEISDKKESVWAYKYPKDTILSNVKYKKISDDTIDRSCFFAHLKEGEVICILNNKLDSKKIFLNYEDKFNNKYYQVFQFDNNYAIGDR